MFVFANESPEKWTALLQVWTDRLQPRDDAEMCIVLDIAHAQWKLRRARTWESGLIDEEMEEQAEGVAAKYEEVDEGIRQSSAFKALADNSRSLDLLHRYETRARRAFDRGLATLEKLRAMAPAVCIDAVRPEAPPAEPEWPQPSENTPVEMDNEILQNEIPGMSEALPESQCPVPAAPTEPDGEILQNESGAVPKPVSRTPAPVRPEHYCDPPAAA